MDSTTPHGDRPPPDSTAPEVVDNLLLLQRSVESWGPGATGVVEVHDLEGLRCSVAVHNKNGRCAVSDTGALNAVDCRSPFVSLHLRRLADREGGRLPLAWDALPHHERSRLFRSELPGDMSEEDAHRATELAMWFAERRYATWLLERLHRNALTFLPADLVAIAAGEQRRGLTPFDRVVVALAAGGHLKLAGWSLEITGHDCVATAPHVEFLQRVGAEVRRGTIHGLAPDTVECNISRNVQARLVDTTSTKTCSSTPPTESLEERASASHRIAPRRFSWIDVNRVSDGANRINNCWNGAAAVATWLGSALPSTALPVYKGSGFRPTIKEYLQVMGAGEVIFAHGEAEVRSAIAAWGPNSHGLVVASLMAQSTHMFNAYVDANGLVHMVDGHTGTCGDYNFAVDWLRIGVARLGALHPGFREPT